MPAVGYKDECGGARENHGYYTQVLRMSRVIYLMTDEAMIMKRLEKGNASTKENGLL